MSRRIVVDPARLETAATKVDSQSADYEKLYLQLFQEIDSMGAAWKGVDNTAYVTQIKGFTDDFQRMTKLMKEYAEFLRLSAKAYRQTQSEIANNAKRLTN
ncbi:WXG100 family type VII secretion target [Bacillus alkalicellulosilyticus]|uniref:WXG100 family type VII secretion target n=1 Tax=Alkalihalobacterium alkalicellulosilyticum TaxID=1912214 RepID=UPI00099818D0|nr:WXG100 family type VII secretion target [Bacillus alkalicellulosilyticus]